MTKTCSNCKEVKDLTEFYKNYQCKDGRHPECKACKRARNAATPQRYRDYKATPKGQYALLYSHGKRRGLEVTLTFREYSALRIEPCFYCQFPLDSRGVGLDRIDSSRGYVADNVVPCCQACNVMKSDLWSMDEFKKVGSIVRELRQARQAAALQQPKIHLKLVRSGNGS